MASTIISSNDSGTVAAVFQDSEGLFGKLSAELKNHFFELALVTPSAIKIKLRGTFIPCAAGKASQIQARMAVPKKLTYAIRACTCNIEGVHLNLRHDRPGRSTGAGLLRTSRSIRAVALPMFYGLNEFRFECDKAFHHFIFETAPVARLLLRQIDIRLANINSFYLPPLGPKHGMKPVKIELYKRGKPSFDFEIWNVLRSFVKGGSPKEQKARLDLLDLSFRPGCLVLNNKAVSGKMSSEQKEHLRDRLLRAWGSTISWQSIDQYDFFPEGVSGYVD